MNTSQLVAEMGNPDKIVSFEAEKKVWVDGEFNIEESIIFLHGFDQVYLFNKNNKYCLWKAYIKDDKVIYMNLTSRFVDENYVQGVTVRNSIHFGDKIDKVVNVLGKNFYPDRQWTYTDYLYHDLGIRFTFKQSRITNIYLYRRFRNKADLYRLVRHFPKDK